MQPLGAAVPRRGNILSRAIGRAILFLLGWRTDGDIPDIPRLVAVAAPHTSNLDFLVALGFIFARGLRVSWIGKHSLFRWPLGVVMRWLGGVPVMRSTTAGQVQQIAEHMKAQPKFFLGLSPEGTRERVERWKSGFYHVAQAAKVPILLFYLDYGRKVVGTGPLFTPTGDVEADMKAIRAFYRDKTPRFPERFDSGT
ncbi:MAG: lysophospholipid acyltransferase family protein [Pseudomonadota bacterium]